ncbi:MAG: putative Ig domain-containing protein, partial [Halobacteriales archaeon]|nr:putative Ig domain-containing protein [Halobacteriales archaeon]
TAQATVAVTVANVNRAPVLDPIPDATVKARTTLAFTVHATDPDSDLVTYAADTLPTGATFNGVTGAFSWTPAKAQAGDYTVTFHARDGSLEDFQAVHITVTKR